MSTAVQTVTTSMYTASVYTAVTAVRTVATVCATAKPTAAEHTR